MVALADEWCGIGMLSLVHLVCVSSYVATVSHGTLKTVEVDPRSQLTGSGVIHHCFSVLGLGRCCVRCMQATVTKHHVRQPMGSSSAESKKAPARRGC